MSNITTRNTIASSTSSPNRRAIQLSEMSWTDDLPQCPLSDVGVASNIVYLADGRATEAYAYEDRAFNFATDNDCYLYGVFDGYDGSRAARFSAERLPAELLLGQLTPHMNDKSIKNILKQALSVVERGFFESIDIELAKKTHLQSQIPDRLPPDVAEKHYPHVVQQIRALNDAIKGGTTAVVALVVNDRLYVANVGDSRALLCQRDIHGRLDVQQITVNHDINNDLELNRISRLGLNVEKVMERGKLGMNECTRCIGDYSVKGGYKENEVLRGAVSEPVIALPDVYGGFPIAEIEGGFLVLMSDDIYKSLEQATGTKNANGDIAGMISHELMCRNRINGVAQNVIDQIAYLHRHAFGKSHTLSRGDITLVVRNINHPTGTNALPDINPDLPDLSGMHPVSVPYNKRDSMELTPAGMKPFEGLSGKPPVTLSLVMPHPSNPSTDPGVVTPARTLPRNAKSSSSTPPSDDTPTNLVGAITDHKAAIIVSAHNSHDQSSLNPDDLFYRPDHHDQMQLDADNKVAPYVSFASFDQEAWEKMRKMKQSSKSIL